RPELVDAVEGPRDARFVGEIATGDELHALMIAVGKALRLLLVAIGHMADRAAREKRFHDGGAEGAGSAGDDDVTIAKVHDCHLSTKGRLTALEVLMIGMVCGMALRKGAWRGRRSPSDRRGNGPRPAPLPPSPADLRRGSERVARSESVRSARREGIDRPRPCLRARPPHGRARRPTPSRSP